MDNLATRLAAAEATIQALTSAVVRGTSVVPLVGGCAVNFVGIHTLDPSDEYYANYFHITEACAACLHGDSSFLTSSVEAAHDTTGVTLIRNGATITTSDQIKIWNNNESQQPNGKMGRWQTCPPSGCGFEVGDIIKFPNVHSICPP